MDEFNLCYAPPRDFIGMSIIVGKGIGLLEKKCDTKDVRTVCIFQTLYLCVCRRRFVCFAKSLCL